MAGEQLRPSGARGITRFNGNPRELAPSTAVRVAVASTVRLLALTLKALVVLPARTTTDTGAVSRELLLVTVTEVPPAGATWLKVTVHVVVAPGLKVDRLQVNFVRLGE
ncbi:hypothetical protein [Paludibaculum fermentans]|uniref:hypothetical protein n=1 Tax=Paludibaculum fermentans TaxID=1473598 RepID=UPI003EBF3AA0